MRSHLLRRALTSMLLIGLMVPASPAGALVESFRELVPIRFHPDASMDCAKWCGLLESCC
jgi:hypothetical protein